MKTQYFKLVAVEQSEIQSGQPFVAVSKLLTEAVLDPGGDKWIHPDFNLTTVESRASVFNFNKLLEHKA